MRLIDADAMLDDVLRQNETIKALGIEELTKMSLTICDGIKQEICNQPTIDAVEVVRGTWTIDGINEYELSYGSTGYEPVYRCSRCGHVTESYLRLDRPIMPEDADFPKYCQNCGAKMGGERRDNE